MAFVLEDVGVTPSADATGGAKGGAGRDQTGDRGHGMRAGESQATLAILRVPTLAVFYCLSYCNVKGARIMLMVQVQDALLRRDGRWQS